MRKDKMGPEEHVFYVREKTTITTKKKVNKFQKRFHNRFCWERKSQSIHISTSRKKLNKDFLKLKKKNKKSPKS